MSDRSNVIAFPACHTCHEGALPGTWRLYLYGRVAYRTATALALAEGVGPDEAEPVCVPAGARELWRVGDGGPAFPTMAEAAALWRIEPGAGLFSVPVVG